MFKSFLNKKILAYYLVIFLILGGLYFVKKNNFFAKKAIPLSPTPPPELAGRGVFPSVPIRGIQKKGNKAEDVDTTFDPVLGKESAPLTFVYWFDYQCPLCRYFELKIMPELIEKYVKTGKMKIVFKDFQFLGQDSQEAGWIGKAVYELYPQYYFEFHQKMYEKQDGENTGFGNYESVLEMIREEFKGKMDAEKINQYARKNRVKYQKEQDDDKAEGILFGIVGTPGFVIGEQKLAGVQPKEVFEEVIKAELEKKLSGRKK